MWGVGGGWVTKSFVLISFYWFASCLKFLSLSTIFFSLEELFRVFGGALRDEPKNGYVGEHNIEF